MTTAPRLDQTFRLALAAPAAVPVLAETLVARHLGLPRSEAARRLALGDLGGPMSPGRARHVAALLRAGGLDVQARPTAQGARLDAALIPAPGADIAAIADRLAPRLDRRAAGIAADLAAPGGLVLAGLVPAEAAVWQAAPRRVLGLTVAVSDPDRALYDLIPWGHAADPGMSVALLRHLRVLGVDRCALTGAPGAGLDAMLRDHVLRRYPAAGVIAVDRAFQRFDLTLIRAPGLSSRDLAGFLGPRAALAPDAFDGFGPDRPLTIDRGIARNAALRFQADYAAIGLETRLRLTRPRADPVPSPVCPRR
ncbi:MAG TPA: hypothetical protein VLA78_12960 [Paracoccaceae bacterium]|nr:hypothetical protein [Paracoccaceae bacterium]